MSEETAEGAPPGSGAAAVAEDVRKKRRASTPEQRAKWRADKRAKRGATSVAAEDEKPERPPYVRTEEGVALSSILGRTLWGILASFTKRRQLTEEEGKALGEALDPVLYKYLPAMGDWAAEIALIMVSWQLWNATAPPPDENEGNENQTENGAKLSLPESPYIGSANVGDGFSR